MSAFERLSFDAEWFQEDACIKRLFILTYFPFDRSVELFDRQKNKVFLKRVIVPEITENCLDIGSKLNIFGRQVIVKACEDDYTKEKLSRQRQKSFGLIPSKHLSKLSEILKIICDNGFKISNCAMYQLTKEQSNELTKTLGFGISNIWSIGPSAAIVVSGPNAYVRFAQLVAGPQRQTNDKRTENLKFGSGAMTDTVFFPNRPEDLNKVCDFFFSNELHSNRLHLCKSLENSTLCLIKPHALIEGKCGEILKQIADNGFVIKGMKMFNLPRKNCEEFYEVYNGVSPDYLQMVTELSSGPLMALEIGKSNLNESAYKAFRELCGPFDPEVAREIRPSTIRARFGVTPTKNAVHCTDLAEDCSLELDYFFKILS